ncbi:MAG: UvrD-helicase domain-containing protein [Bacteroidales bacterium]|jgi:ATP-dependent exoDNAse (exonuclease V) beta subunit|nr:UvrD-helicase domain-containing protein [Bacteroidales bacterium]
MTNNKLLIAATGSGKTTFIVNKSLEYTDGKILITTYTQANEAEIRKKLLKKQMYSRKYNCSDMVFISLTTWSATFSRSFV